MKKNIWIIIGITTFLLVAAVSFLWATAIMDSLYDFRSPLANDPPMSEPSLGEPLSSRVVFVLVDALREDTALNTEVMPFLDELRQQSAWATMHSLPPSYSAPSWTTLLTGAWADINDGQPANPPDNDSVRAFTQDDIFAAANRAGLQTAVSGFTWFEGMLTNSGVDADFYTTGEDNAADLDVLSAAIPWLQSDEYQLILIHLDQVDYAGHYEGGPQDPNWDAAAARVDNMLEEISSTLNFELDTLIVTSDHGQIDRGGHGGQDPITLIEPFIMIGPNITPGNYPDIQMVDVAPTISALLGINLPGTNQGRVLTEMLKIDSEQVDVINNILSAQKLQLLQSYQTSIGVEITSPETLEEIDSEMEEAKSQRLFKERIPRGIIALIIALIPVYVLSKNFKRTSVAVLAGAAQYIFIFNVIYAVIIGKTYSLSSVYSADDLIFSTAIYAGIALFIAWLILMLNLKAFSLPPSSTALLTLSLTAITLYILVLPILWNYFMNGLVLTWTLPDFSSMFMGFLSILQSLFVSVLGLLLTGISALISRLVHTD